MKLYFIRHGESQANEQAVFAGQWDAPLTERGRKQAAYTAGFLRNIPFTAVYASDLSRALDTGRMIADVHRLPVQPLSSLREINAGQWERQPFTVLEKQDSYQLWLSRIGLAACPGGESVAALQRRIRQAVEIIARRHPGGMVCIATHATPIRVMECLWRGVPLEQMHTIPWVKNASVTVAEYDEQPRGRLLERDIVTHLGELATTLQANV